MPHGDVATVSSFLPPANYICFLTAIPALEPLQLRFAGPLTAPNAPHSTSDCPVRRSACFGSIAFEAGRATIIFPAVLTYYEILMKQPYHYSEGDLRRVVQKMVPSLRLQITEAEIKAVFEELSLAPPTRAVSSHIRKMLDIETKKMTELLCNRLSDRFEREPKPKDVALALNDAGYSYSRQFFLNLMDLLRKRNAERWASAPGIIKKVVNLTEGELAVWHGLQNTYGLPSDALASMLLRLFVVVTATGKVSPSEVPYLTSSIAFIDMKKYAKSLNFEIKKIRKPRA